MSIPCGGGGFDYTYQLFKGVADQQSSKDIKTTYKNRLVNALLILIAY